MRAIWKGAVAFGLVNVPVKLYAATGEQDVPLHQVHREDGGRIRYKKTCSVCGEPVEMRDIAKGYQTDDGKLVVLTDEDMAQLPLSTERRDLGARVRPGRAGRPDHARPRRTTSSRTRRPPSRTPCCARRWRRPTGWPWSRSRCASASRMAVLRVRDDVICLQTLLWPDEIRAADFPILDAEVDRAPAGADDGVVAGGVARGRLRPRRTSTTPTARRSRRSSRRRSRPARRRACRRRPAPDDEAAGGGEVIDLLSALQRSVEKARGARGGGAAAGGAAVRDAAASDGADRRATTPRTPRTTEEAARPSRPAGRAAAQTAAAAEPTRGEARPARKRTASDGRRDQGRRAGGGRGRGRGGAGPDRAVDRAASSARTRGSEGAGGRAARGSRSRRTRRRPASRPRGRARRRAVRRHPHEGRRGEGGQTAAATTTTEAEPTKPASPPRRPDEARGRQATADRAGRRAS